MLRKFASLYIGSARSSRTVPYDTFLPTGSWAYIMVLMAQFRVEFYLYSSLNPIIKPRGLCYSVALRVKEESNWSVAFLTSPQRLEALLNGLNTDLHPWCDPGWILKSSIIFLLILFFFQIL